MRWSRRILLYLALAALVTMAAVQMSCFTERHRGWNGLAEHDIRLRRSVPAPIVFLHGLGGNARTWAGLTQFLTAKGLHDGGIVRFGRDGRPEIVFAAEPPDRADFLRLEVVDSYQSLDRWTADLEKLLSEVRRRSKAPRVVLVGYSVGGLTGRKYLVEHPRDHGLAKLLTISAPHKGTYLAEVPLFLQDARAWAERNGEIANLLINIPLSKLEEFVGFGMGKPVFADLLPEKANPSLAALNAAPHPQDLEYECVRSYVDDLGESRRLFQTDAIDKYQAANILSRLLELLRDNSSWAGDGAVPVYSQDLRALDFLGRHSELISACRGINANHSEVLERHGDILSGISSRVRFLRARSFDDPLSDGEMIEFDFQDYLAGRVQVKAKDPFTNRFLPISRPAVYQRGNEIFGRVVIGPVDPQKITDIDVVVRSLDWGRRYGKSISLRRSPKTQVSSHTDEEKPITVLLHRVERLPDESSPFDFLLNSGLQLVLRADGREMLRTRMYSNSEEGVDLEESAQLNDEAWESPITLEVYKSGSLIGTASWEPGELPRHRRFIAKTTQGPVIQMEVKGPQERPIEWDNEPFKLF
jgi:pimeloyl-ACP methyl ester carboxylesterase